MEMHIKGLLGSLIESIGKHLSLKFLGFLFNSFFSSFACHHLGVLVEKLLEFLCLQDLKVD